MDGACTWESQNASGDFPPDSAIALPAVLLKENCGFPEWDVCCTGLDFCKYRHRYVDGDIFLVRLCLSEQLDLRDIRVQDDDNVNVRGLNHRLTIFGIWMLRILSPSRCVMIACV